MLGQPSSPASTGRPSPAQIASELRATARALLQIADSLDGAPSTPPVRALPAPNGPAASANPATEPPRLEDRLTSRQLGAIRAASRRAGMSRNQLSELLQETAGVADPALLTRSSASAVLDRLSSRTGYR